jgi:hypothetical protein
MQDAPRPIISNGVPFKNQHIACNFTQSVREDAEDLIPPEEDLLFQQKQIFFFFFWKKVTFFFFLKEMIFDDFRFSHVEKLDCLLLRLPDGVLRSL